MEKPGKYDLRSDLTVTEAVAIAGGFTDKSKHSQVVLFRPSRVAGMKRSSLISRNCSRRAICPKIFNCNLGTCYTYRKSTVENSALFSDLKYGCVSGLGDPLSLYFHLSHNLALSDFRIPYV